MSLELSIRSWRKLRSKKEYRLYGNTY